MARWRTRSSWAVPNRWVPEESTVPDGRGYRWSSSWATWAARSAAPSRPRVRTIACAAIVRSCARSICFDATLGVLQGDQAYRTKEVRLARDEFLRVVGADVLDGPRPQRSRGTSTTSHSLPDETDRSVRAPEQNRPPSAPRCRSEHGCAPREVGEEWQPPASPPPGSLVDIRLPERTSLIQIADVPTPSMDPVTGPGPRVEQ